MQKHLNSYLKLLKQRDFLVLMLVIFLGQIATAFLILSLITSVYTRTGSNFGVSGVILSLAVPSLVLMATAGLISDIFDRKKIILLTNLFISFVVLLILFSQENVFLSIFLSFLYFAGNSFFLPAVSAASAQVVKKRDLMISNSLFFIGIASGQIGGLFIAAVILFFFGNFVLLILCEVLLVICAFLPLLLPRLLPRQNGSGPMVIRIFEIMRTFRYIFRAKTIWFYFVIFALMQGVVAFSTTIAPGFFNDVVGISINKSPLFIFPPIAIGILLGILFTHTKKLQESIFTIVGTGVLGIASVIFGLNIDFGKVNLTLASFIFLVCGGFTLMICMVASRTVLQRRVPHEYQGTIFGANFVLSSLFASIFSPLAATFVALANYSGVFILVGLMFMIFSAIIGQMRKRWTF